MARLKRMSDGAGDVGSRVDAIAWNEDRSFKEVVSNYPTVGCSLLVGNGTARTYCMQDFWLTTVVAEILEERDRYVKFKTENSVYELFL